MTGDHEEHEGLLPGRSRTDPLRRPRRRRRTGLPGVRPRPARARQAHGGPPPHRRGLLALLRLPGRGRVRGGHLGSAVARSGDGPDAGRPDEDGRGLRVPRQARRALLLLPRRRHRPGRRHLRRDEAQPRGHGRLCRAAHAAHRRAAPVGHGQPLRPSPLRRRRRHQPGPGGVRLRRRPGEERHRRHPPPRGDQLRPLGRPGGLRHPAQHPPAPGSRPVRPLPLDGGGVQAPDRVHRAPCSSSRSRRSRPSTSTTPTAPRSTGSWSATASSARSS